MKYNDALKHVQISMDDFQCITEPASYIQKK